MIHPHVCGENFFVAEYVYLDWTQLHARGENALVSKAPGEGQDPTLPVRENLSP